MSRVRFIGALVGIGLLFGCASLPVKTSSVCPKNFRGFEALSVQAEPLTAFEEGFGNLQFRGALKLTSDAKRFGGLSGIDLLCENKFVLISDHGNLFTASFTEDTTGMMHLSGSFMVAPMRDAEGTVLAQKNGGRTSDSESVDWDGKTLLVSFEQQHRILSFALSDEGAGAKGKEIARLSELGGNANHGMESLTRTSDGNIIVALEREIDGSAPMAIASMGDKLDFSGEGLPLRGNTRLTGFDVLPATQHHPQLLFSLHRDWNHEVKGKSTIRIMVSRLVPDEQGKLELGPTRILSKFHQATAASPGNNFEGITVRQLPGGGARLYLVTDNNFDPSGRQTTLLLTLDVPADLVNQIKK